MDRWCAAIGVPWMWVSDTVRHFKTRALQLVAESVGTSHRFAVANSAWTNGTVEHMMRELVRIFKVLHNEKRCPLADWVLIVPVVQCAFNAAYLQRYRVCPY